MNTNVIYCMTMNYVMLLSVQLLGQLLAALGLQCSQAKECAAH